MSKPIHTISLQTPSTKFKEANRKLFNRKLGELLWNGNFLLFISSFLVLCLKLRDFSIHKADFFFSLCSVVVIGTGYLFLPDLYHLMNWYITQIKSHKKATESNDSRIEFYEKYIFVKVISREEYIKYNLILELAISLEYVVIAMQDFEEHIFPYESFNDNQLATLTDFLKSMGIETTNNIE